MAIPADVTGLLRAWSNGDDTALEQLVPIVEDELRRLARARMVRERRNHTLQPTALVNEVFLRFNSARGLEWRDRSHFLAIAARLMRRVLVDHARARGYRKRGGQAERVTLDGSVLELSQPPVDFIDLDRALDRFASLDERRARVVELRFFGGLTVEETADVLRVSAETVNRDWRLARLWLLRELDATGAHKELQG